MQTSVLWINLEGINIEAGTSAQVLEYCGHHSQWLRPINQSQICS